MKYTKSLNYVLNQNVNVTKRARFATFAISTLDNFCLLQQCKLSKIKIWLPRLIINVPYGLIRDHSWLFHQPLKKKLAVVDRLFWQLGTCVCGRGRCREMAVSLDSTVFPLFFFSNSHLNYYKAYFIQWRGNQERKLRRIWLSGYPFISRKLC